MTIVYWDFLNGSDEIGDGSAGNPYKTLSKATTGLTGGDEVRCAKSPDPANLGCNLTFTDGSKSVATAADLTAVLGAKDFVSLNTAGETWWEISSINSTTITLVVAYRGTGGTGTGYKRGITGSIAGVTVADGSSTTAVHTISASGTSSSKLKLSFGWNLSGTPTQDGQTFFFQSNATKGGRAIYASSKNYIEIDGARLGMLRYSAGIYGSGSSNWTITSCTSLEQQLQDLRRQQQQQLTINVAHAMEQHHGIYGYQQQLTITSCTYNGTAPTGFGTPAAIDDNQLHAMGTTTGFGYTAAIDDNQLHMQWEQLRVTATPAAIDDNQLHMQCEQQLQDLRQLRRSN